MVEKVDLAAVCAQRQYGLSKDWEIYKWERKEGFFSVSGAVCNEVITRGKGKGRKNWRKLDKSTEATVTISDEAFKTFLATWEAETGLCHECQGTAEVWASWDHQKGMTYKPCSRCGATGKAKPVTAAA